MKQKLAIRVMALVLLASLCGTLLCVSAADIPAKVTPASNVTVYSNQKALLDASNLAEGFLGVSYTGGKQTAIKVQIAKSGGSTYTYNLNNKGTVETFALTEGDGKYTVKVLENTTGTKYALAYSKELDVTLSSEFAPFLYPNQYVNFAADSKTVKKGAELVKNEKTDLQRLTKIYGYVVNNFTYDTKKAQTVKSGYLPIVDQVLEEKKGICFDYAAVMAAMLRSQNIPCKLVVGYAGTIYHAWINVYLSETGWVEKAVYFDGKKWSLMDPTFASSGKGNASVAKYIGDGKNYTQKFAY